MIDTLEEKLKLKRQAWLAKHHSDTPQLEPKEQQLLDEIRANPRGMKLLLGVYGDQDHGNAYEEDVIRTPQGSYTKLYGCSYLLPGFIDKEIIDHATTVKRIWREDVRFVLSFPGILLLPFCLLKSVQTKLIRRYARISEAHLLQLKYPYPQWKLQDSDLHPAIREFVRVARKFTAKIPQVENPDDFLKKCYETNPQNCTRNCVNEIVDTVALFLFADNAYLLPVQDVMSLLDKTKLGLNARKEILRILDIGIERSRHIQGKLLLARRLVSLLLRIKKFRTMIVDFLFQLDLEKIRMDHATHYFSLKREGYDYGGVSLEDRIKERERIDKEKGHIILNC